MTGKTAGPSAALAELAVATATVRQQLERVPLPSVRQALDDWSAAWLRWAGTVTDELNRQAVNIEATSVQIEMTDKNLEAALSLRNIVGRRDGA
jgi:hypothetical protein